MYQQEKKGPCRSGTVLAAHKAVGCFVFCNRARTRAHGKGVLMQRATRDSEYDLNSAVTFLLLGLGLGAVLGIAFNPKQNVAPQGINGRRMFGLQPRREAEERVA
jgi:hypothetical protein